VEHEVRVTFQNAFWHAKPVSISSSPDSFVYDSSEENGWKLEFPHPPKAGGIFSTDATVSSIRAPCHNATGWCRRLLSIVRADPPNLPVRHTSCVFPFHIANDRRGEIIHLRQKP
jgi:hypothetical protein